MKKFLRLSVLLAAIISLSACSDLLGLYKPVPVSSITITSGWDGISSVSYNSQLQLVALIAPANASFQLVAWSVVDSSSSLPSLYASIDSNGILYINDPSGYTLTVTATAVDGSGATASVTIPISGS